ncbi:MAG: hypothetical protein KJO77_07880 [Bacteroidia bacterium]|nr:hypothetical protein [Bacteroidia bacterium]NND52204.1 hypothetical protein [Flavobacteriaceae bacterium]
MRKYLILLTFCLLCFHCSVSEKPDFLGVENIKVLEAHAEIITVSADAKFRNPNDIGGKLRADGIKVFINDVETATLTTEDFEVPSKDLFTIPLVVEVPTDSIFNRKSIGGLLGSLLSEKVKVQYKGSIKYKVFGFSHTYAIDQTEDVKIKL